MLRAALTRCIMMPFVVFTGTLVDTAGRYWAVYSPSESTAHAMEVQLQLSIYSPTHAGAYLARASCAHIPDTVAVPSLWLRF